MGGTSCRRRRSRRLYINAEAAQVWPRGEESAQNEEQLDQRASYCTSKKEFSELEINFLLLLPCQTMVAPPSLNFVI